MNRASDSRAGAAVAIDGKLRIPHFDTEFSINFTSKSPSKYGINVPAVISVGPRPNLFYALIDEEDVNFSIKVNNSNCLYRSVLFELGIHDKSYAFSQPEKTEGRLETLETHGRKFHFVSQNSTEGQSLTSQAAAKYGISYREASKLISRIKFHVEYSLESKIPVIIMNIITCEEKDEKATIFIWPSEKVEDLKEKIGLLYQVDPIRFFLYFNGAVLKQGRSLESCGVQENSRIHFIFQERLNTDLILDLNINAFQLFPIYIQTLSGKRTKVDVRGTDTISKLKERIENKMGYRKDVQKILYGGKQLEDYRTLHSFDIEERTILFLCIKVVGGHQHHLSTASRKVLHQIFSQSESESESVFETGTESEESVEIGIGSRKKKSSLEIGERGAICLGEKSNQRFVTGTFKADPSVEIQNFTIELRKSPKYGLL